MAEIGNRNFERLAASAGCQSQDFREHHGEAVALNTERAVHLATALIGRGLVCLLGCAEIQGASSHRHMNEQLLKTARLTSQLQHEKPVRPRWLLGSPRSLERNVGMRKDSMSLLLRGAGCAVSFAAASAGRLIF